MKFNVYDIGTMCLGLLLGIVFVSDIPIVKKIIMMGLLVVSAFQFISLKIKYKFKNKAEKIG